MASKQRTPLARLRELCLALPDAHEVEAWGEPTFRVNNKLFAMYAADGNHHGAGRSSVWIKSQHVTQDMLVRAQPEQYFAPPYVGPKGWTGAFLDRDPDWDIVGDLLRDAYLATVPKRVKAKLDAAAREQGVAPRKTNRKSAGSNTTTRAKTAPKRAKRTSTTSAKTAKKRR